MEKLKTKIKKKLGKFSIPLVEVYYWLRYIVKYYGFKYKCPCCGAHLARFASAVIDFDKKVNDYLCPRCDSHPRHRLLWLFLQERCSHLNTEKLKLLHLAPEYCFLRRFISMKNINYITGDLSSPFASCYLDLTELPFSDEIFDFVLCNHVLEHIHNDKKAIAEVFRIVKIEGMAILQVPIYADLQITYENDNIQSDHDRSLHFGQHDHVRKYGKDYSDKLIEVGFTVVESRYIDNISTDDKLLYGLDSGETIYLCIKNTTRRHVI